MDELVTSPVEDAEVPAAPPTASRNGGRWSGTEHDLFGYIYLWRVVQHLGTILESADRLGLSDERVKKLEKFLNHVREIPAAASATRDLAFATARANAEALVPVAAGADDKFFDSITDWNRKAFRAFLLSRDLKNRLYLRARQKDREQIAQAIAEHPLTRSWDDLGEVEAVERIVTSRRAKFYNRQLRCYEILKQETFVTALPTRLTIEPTSMCNFRCVMCPHGIHDERPLYVEMTDRQVEDLVPYLPLLENLGVQVAGEPTSSLQLGKIANFATCHAVDVDMITNGSLMHQTNADLSKFSTITISFDGATKETFEAQRAGANFERVVSNIRAVRDKSPLVTMDFNVCLTRLNLEELPDIVRLAGDIGIDRVRVTPLVVRDMQHLKNMALTRSEYPRIREIVDQARKIGEEMGVNMVVQVHEKVLNDTPTPANPTRQTMFADLSAIVTKGNISDVSDMVDALEKIDITLPPPISGPDMNPEAPATSQEEIQEPPVPEVVADPAPLKVIESMPLASEDAPGMAFDPADRPPTFKIPYCNAPWVGGLVMSPGHYMPCCYLGAHPMGTTAEESFADIWNGEKVIQLRQNMIDGHGFPDTCESCNGLQRYQTMAELIALAARLNYRWEDIEWPRNFDPPPGFKVKFEQMREELFDQPAPDYKLGTDVVMGDPASSKYCRFGLTPPASGGRWTEGYESDLKFKLVDWNGKDRLRLRLRAMPYIDEKLHPVQRIDVRVAGETVTRWTFSDKGSKNAEMVIEPDLVDADQCLTVTLALLDAVSPKDLGQRRATVARAIFIDRVSVERDSLWRRGWRAIA